MDIEKLRKNAEAKGFSFKYFATAREAADYMVGELAGRSVGIGGSKTVDTLDIYDRLVRGVSGRGLALEAGAGRRQGTRRAQRGLCDQCQRHRRDR